MNDQDQAAKPFRELRTVQPLLEHARIPTYVCHKQVKAFQIREISPDVVLGGATLTPAEDGLRLYHVTGAFMLKHQPQPGGYLVIYADGYESFSPAKAFEDGYTRL